MCELTDLDKKILKGLANHETKIVAFNLSISENVIYSHLHKIRKNRVMAQTFLNRLLGYEKRNPALKKMLTPTKVAQRARA